MQAGKWERSKYMGWEVRGKTLGVIGLGRIGTEVSRRARSFEMNIVAYDPVVSFERAAQLGIKMVALEELLATSDIVTLHVPLVDQTRNLLNAERIAGMKQGAYLVNASRGGIVDEAAMLQALEAGQLAGAALDVYGKEPPTDNPVVGNPKIVTLPHLGASTIEAQAQTGSDVAEGVLTALAGNTPRYAVNAPFVAPEAWNVLAPYIALGTRMGSLIRQLISQPTGSYEVDYCGELANIDAIPVRLAVLQGLLAGTTDQRVTPVNAPLIARDRGLQLIERTLPHLDDYTGLLVVRAHTTSGEVREFSGTVLRDQPYMVQADGYWVGFEPGGPLLLTYHTDQPGIIGNVGTMLGAANVNISGMYVGRQAPREKAMMVLTLDEPVPTEVLEQIRAQPGITGGYSVTL
jgi:D-3-phosphoglycerate dehydrogenase